MDTIGDIFAKKNKNSPLMKSITAALVVEDFDKSLVSQWGEKVKDQAKGLHLKNKILTVACMNAMIANELKLKERTFIIPLNQKFGLGTVDKLKILL